MHKVLSGHDREWKTPLFFIPKSQNQEKEKKVREKGGRSTVYMVFGGLLMFLRNAGIYL
jgi:hypothetical protein